MSEKLSERLEALCAIKGRPFTVAERAESLILMSRAAAALRAVEGAVSYEVEACKFEVAPEEFDLRGSISCAASFIGKRVALVPLDAAGSAPSTPHE